MDTLELIEMNGPAPMPKSGEMSLNKALFALYPPSPTHLGVRGENIPRDH